MNIKKLLYTFIFLSLILRSIITFSQVISKDLNEVLDFFEFSHIDTNKVYEWGFIFAGKDSLQLKNGIIEIFKNNQFDKIDYFLFAEDDIEYPGYYRCNIYKKRKYTPISFYEDILKFKSEAENKDLVLIGHQVTKEGKDISSTPLKNDCSSYSLNGSLIDETTNQSIPYVDVGIVGKNIGTMTDENGDFEIEISNENINDVITFSCLGYETVEIKVEDLIKTSSIVLLMKPQVEILNEVIVLAPKSKQKRKEIGNSRKPNFSGFVHGLDMGAEAAQFFKNNESIKLLSTSVYIGKKIENIRYILKLNIYSVNDFKNLNDATLVYTQIIESNVNNTWLNTSFDQPIYLSGNFIIAYQWLEKSYNYSTVTIGFTKSLFSSNGSIQRSVSLGKWVESRSFNWAIKAKILE